MGSVGDTKESRPVDKRNRPLHDLRISLTDRCNFRCTYCMPKEVFGPDFAFLPREELLTNPEIIRLAGLFVQCGVSKIRLTGGEPLLRSDLDPLIQSLSRMEGVEEIALTTNGSILTDERAKRLKAAGLSRINVSLDALDDAVFQKMNDVHFPVQKVLAAIEAAKGARIAPVKVNMVVRRGWNEDQIVPMAEYFRGTGTILRFIEFMDVGNSNHWRYDEVVSAKEIVTTIGKVWPLEPVAPNYQGEVAARYRYVDGKGEIGVIASVTQAFCGDCTRARLSPEGKLFTCLFRDTGPDFRALLRQGSSDDDILDVIRQTWRMRDDKYSEQRAELAGRVHKVEMSHIGG